MSYVLRSVPSSIVDTASKTRTGTYCTLNALQYDHELLTFDSGTGRDHININLQQRVWYTMATRHHGQQYGGVHLIASLHIIADHEFAGRAMAFPGGGHQYRASPEWGVATATATATVTVTVTTRIRQERGEVSWKEDSHIFVLCFTATRCCHLYRE